MALRMTLGEIEELIDKSRVEYLGTVRFKRQKPGSRMLLVTLPHETREIEMPKGMGFDTFGEYRDELSRQHSREFIRYVNQFLTKERLYITNSLYQPYRKGAFHRLPEELSGDVWQEVEVAETPKNEEKREDKSTKDKPEIVVESI